MIVGRLHGGFVRARLVAYGQEFELSGGVRGAQVSGVWQGSGASGSFALQGTGSFDRLNIALESSDCKPATKWEGNYSYAGRNITFTLSDAVLDRDYFFSANGLEGGSSFTLRGIVLNNRARLIKTYKGSADPIALHLRLGNGIMSGVWIKG